MKRTKGKVQQQGNKYEYQDHDNLEFDGEIEDLEDEYGNYGSGSQQQKSGEKKLGGKIGFLKNLTEHKTSQEKPDDGMDFILDDPDNLENLSDY